MFILLENPNAHCKSRAQKKPYDGKKENADTTISLQACGHLDACTEGSALTPTRKRATKTLQKKWKKRPNDQLKSYQNKRKKECEVGNSTSSGTETNIQEPSK